MKTFSVLFINFLFCVVCAAKQPDITEKNVHEKVEKILEAHVNYDQLNEEIMNRALSNYIEELDPHKTYLIEKEVSPYLNPSKNLLKKCLSEYKSKNFKVFEQIYTLFTKTIIRRNKLEKAIEKKPLKESIDSKLFKDIKWAKDEAELEKRLLDIRSLQTQNADKMSDFTKKDILKHIDKRRRNREKDFLQKKQRKQHICTLLLKALASSFDTHTNYFTPNEANQFMIRVQQRLFGIGAQLRDTFNGFTILRIIEGGPAEKSQKLKINDRIIAVNHEPIIGMDIAEGVEKIRGEQGTNVVLTVFRELQEGKNEQFELTLTRDEIVIEETRMKSSFAPFADGVIAYLKLYSFYQDENTSSTKDLKKALEEIEKEHKIKGVVLDLRGNGGGLIKEAVGVTGLFIHQGIVTSVKSSTGKIDHLREVNSSCSYDGPLVVLTDKVSASASEIVAQSLQDYQRALIIGDESTTGKGSVQEFTLGSKSPGKVNPEGEYKVTTRKYYTVSGKSPQLVGVKADIVVPGIFSTADIGEKFAKYPLENDKISANFEDPLDDIPFIHRYQAAKMFKFDPQVVTDVFLKHLPILKKNSEIRLKDHKDYQEFIKQISLENYDDDSIDYFRKADLQRQEAENILKDLVYLCEKKAAS